MDIRKEITVLPADESGKKRLGYKCYEQQPGETWVELHKRVLPSKEFEEWKTKYMQKALDSLEKLTDDSIELWKSEDKLSDAEWDDRWDKLRKRHSEIGESLNLV